MCISSLTWICFRDVNVYTSGLALSLDYFCGFIDVQNAQQSPTIWNIHVKPNVHVHFLKFSLFNYYWHCDFEYIQVTTTNKASTFCGNRLPWIYDASDVSASFILSTKRFSSKHIQVELQYYGAYVQNYQHFVVFMELYSIINSRLPDMQNEIETFHFISNSKLDVLNFVPINMCSKMQLICYDGSGIKAPVLQFIHNQSTYKCVSSTFQMFCEFLVTDTGCLNSFTVPQFHYHATSAEEGEFNSIDSAQVACANTNIRNTYCKYPLHVRLRINETVNRGPTKYMYKHKPFPERDLILRALVTVNMMSVSFPYMIYEGHSCMYGGVYVIETLSSDVSEIFTHCNQSSTMNGEELDFNINIVKIVIHYIEYSGPTITIDVEIKDVHTRPRWPVNLKHSDTKSVNITLDHMFLEYTLILKSILLDLRSIQYIYITFEKEMIIDKIDVDVGFNAWDTDVCIYCTLVYSPHANNIRGRQYDVEVLSRAFKRSDIIQSISINTSSCSAFIIPMWSVAIQLVLRLHDLNFITFEGLNTTSNAVLSNLIMWKQYKLKEEHYQAPFWYMVHMIKPADIPPYAIWRVWMEACFSLSHAALEVPTDNHLSTSVFKWNYFNNNYNVFMTIDAVVNLLFESDNMTIPNESCQDAFKVWFRRHFVYDDRITQYVPGQTSEQNFTFHNLR